MTEERKNEPLDVIHIGRLEYLTWESPWKIGAVDIRRDFWRAAIRWRGKPCVHEYGHAHYGLYPRNAARWELHWETIGGGLILRSRESFGFVNVAAYFEDAMMRMNGRGVIFEASETSLLLRADPADEVPGRLYHKRGNEAVIPPGEEKTVCKVGGADACLFVACGDDGFTCLKFEGPAARSLLARKADGTIRATRIGPCAIIGRS
ncbi:hypothetical protein BJ122_102225 [Rhodopseudomonas faecalis]|uniref:Uncharacterized protein n=1 Tax=Rhodopseudomonas faecalis TaxID=99655 RepID=A0A318TZD1_9BRAD|nr:hypothetical protein [Rhodopseudomonas faecalis]PYF04999.1 hypothetical protein BJ122_102225 [Rhodopseudomonas faecalis]